MRPSRKVDGVKEVLSNSLAEGATKCFPICVVMVSAAVEVLISD